MKKIKKKNYKTATRYIDAFVIPISKKNLEKYRKMALDAGQIWMDHGALAFYETVGDDLNILKGSVTFPKMARLKKGEVLLFSWIQYKSRAHRDRVNNKVIKDRRMADAEHYGPLFEIKTMSYGGFECIVSLGK